MTTITPRKTTESVRFTDGSTIELRPLGIRDGRLLSSFVSQLSPESHNRRLLSGGGGVRSEWVASLINADQLDCLVYGAVAVNEFGSALVAVAESIRDPGDRRRAEFALAAVDPWQDMGIGTLLTRHVTRIARSRGIRCWETHMLAENTGMARVMDHVGIRVGYSVHMGLASIVHELDRL